MSSAEELTGRTALVTGGSRGIGAAICRSLGGAGATVAVNYVRDEGAARAVADSLGEGNAIWRADVRRRDEVDAMVAGVVERYSGLDILVVNAGTWRGGRIEDLSPTDWQAVIETSLTGAYHLAHAAAPALRRSSGRLIVISSVIGLVGFPGDGAYAAAKAGLFGLVKSLAKELGRDGATVNAVAPGFVETDMTAAVDGAARERMLRRTALRRAGRVEEVAAAVRFLAGDGAAYVTGQTLVVDGGFSL
jgi:3-oxoacyl-[acyl-carrier protein] reductase